MAKGMKWDVKTANLLRKPVLRYFLEKLGAMNIDRPLIYDDATFKGDLQVNRLIFGTLSADTLVTQAQDFKVHQDLIVQDDATVKQDLYVENSIFIGSSPTRIDSTRGIRLEGSSTVWDDLRFPVSNVKVNPATDKPDFAAITGNLWGYRFDPASVESVHFVVQLPHNWKEGSTIHPHIHWTPIDGNDGKIVWALEYSHTGLNDSFPTSVILDTTSRCGMGVSHQLTNFPNITSPAGLGMSSIIWCRLFRKATHWEDDYASDAGLLEIDFHVELDSLGSVSEWSKNRQNTKVPGWQLHIT